MQFNKPLAVYAVKDKDEKALSRAASGGAFSVLARPIISLGGVVFGAKTHDGGVVQHAAAESLDEISQLQGSAYVQSDIEGVFQSIVEFLRDGRIVLFVGLPCQCAAVLSYVRVKLPKGLDSEKLFLCDLVCHGAPNDELFQAHQHWLGRKRKSDDGIHSFQFRTKRKGWGLYYYYYYYYRNGRKHEVCEPGDSDPYYAAFLRGETYRESCYRCPFAKGERVTDFTIGDYWGIESVHPEFYDPNGVSLLTLNSAKSMRYFEEYSSKECESIVSNMECAAKENHNLNGPTERPKSRDALLEAIANRRTLGDLEAIFDTTLKPRMTIRRVVKRVLPASFYSAAKRILKGGR